MQRSTRRWNMHTPKKLLVRAAAGGDETHLLISYWWRRFWAATYILKVGLRLSSSLVEWKVEVSSSACGYFQPQQGATSIVSCLDGRQLGQAEVLSASLSHWRDLWGSHCRGGGGQPEYPSGKEMKEWMSLNSTDSVIYLSNVLWTNGKYVLARM